MISNSKFYRQSVANAVEILLKEGKTRKSVLIHNTDNAVSLLIGNSRTFQANGHYLTIPPNSVLTLDIPEDNPREPLWAYAASSITVEVYEAYAK